MPEERTNQELLDAWQSGDERAAAALVNRYLIRLTALVRARLSRRLARRIEAEDVVLSAWRSFFLAASNGRAAPNDDGDLWPLLATLTLRKLSRQAARQRAQRRSVDREQHDSHALAEFAARDPTPEDAIEIAEEVEEIVSRLDGIDREVFIRRLRGESTARIAEALQCSDRTVRRAAERARRILEETSGFGRSEAKSSAERPACAQQITETAPACRRSVAAPSPDTDLSQFLLHEMIGEGGFGKVYRARWLATGETVAVKFLRKRLWSDRRAVALLIHEREILAELSDPAIVACRGWGRTPYGAVFLVMDHIDGEDLAVWARRTHPGVREMADAVASAAEALSAAHARGILHCDLKPSNILRCPSGRIVLANFGFARRASDIDSTASAGGTAGFLAPEQVSDAFGSVSPRTDVYGLGAVLYALLTGRPPMTGRDLGEVLARILSSQGSESPSRTNPAVPPPLEAALLPCLAKEPAARPATATEAARLLREW